MDLSPITLILALLSAGLLALLAVLLLRRPSTPVAPGPSAAEAQIAQLAGQIQHLASHQAEATATTQTVSPNACCCRNAR